MNEQAIELEIQQKGLTAPRVTPEMVDDQIVGCGFWRPDGTTLTVCCMLLKNGFTVTGESACASPENFNQELGEKIARDNARQKIWALEGYRLRSELVKS
jgi:hypothetical protein